MMHKVWVAAFADEKELLEAVTTVRERGLPPIEVYTPYAVHGLDHALGWRRSRLSAACFVCGLLGVLLALGFQFWASGWNWPLNVGGQPWNSLPAFVPVTFETMVLFAGLGLVLAWLIRCRLYPGKKPLLPQPGVTDNRFVLILGDSSPPKEMGEVREILQECRPVSLEERDM